MIWGKIAEFENGSKKSALCVIISTSGSTPRKPGAKMLVLEDRRIWGTIGGGSLEMKVIDQALDVIREGSPRVFKHNLVSELGMCCGGTVEIFIEPLVNRKKLYIFGAGHIGKALSKLALALDFNVTLIDERYEAFDGFDTDSCATIRAHHQQAIGELTFDENTFIVIVTHNHAYDREILAITAGKKHAYLGMIGSRRKVEIAKKNLLGGGILSPEEIQTIDMPMGIPINAVTPEEIAVSILARLIDVRNGGTVKK